MVAQHGGNIALRHIQDPSEAVEIGLFRPLLLMTTKDWVLLVPVASQCPVAELEFLVMGLRKIM